MRTPPIERTLLFCSTFRLAAHGSHRRAMLGVLGLMCLSILSWLMYRSWTEWSIKAVLRTVGDTWPLAFSVDARMFATSSQAGVTLWEIDSGRKRATWDVDASRSAVVGVFSPDGRVFAMALANPPQPIAIALVDVATGRVRATLPSGHTGIYDLAFASDGRTLRAFLGDVPNLKEVVRWDIATGEETTRRSVTCPTNGCDTAISPDGHRIALVPYVRKVKTVTIWDVDAECELTRLSSPSSAGALGRGLGFSNDNHTLAVGRDDGAIEIWDLPSRRLRTVLQGHTADYVSWWIRFAPDGRTLASHGEYFRPSSLTGGLRLVFGRVLQGQTWRPAPESIVLDIKTGRRVARASSAIHPFYSPDGASIATREIDRSVRIRPVPTYPR